MKGKKGIILGKFNIRVDKLLKNVIVLLFVFFMVFVYRNDKSDASVLAGETIEFLKTVCQRYDRYEIGRKASALNTVYEKSRWLAGYTSTDNLQSSFFLKRFAAERGLSGVIVTDEMLKPAAQADPEAVSMQSA